MFIFYVLCLVGQDDHWQYWLVQRVLETDDLELHVFHVFLKLRSRESRERMGHNLVDNSSHPAKVTWLIDWLIKYIKKGNFHVVLECVNTTFLTTLYVALVLKRFLGLKGFSINVFKKKDAGWDWAHRFQAFPRPRVILHIHFRPPSYTSMLESVPKTKWINLWFMDILFLWTCKNMNNGRYLHKIININRIFISRWVKRPKTWRK